MAGDTEADPLGDEIQDSVRFIFYAFVSPSNLLALRPAILALLEHGLIWVNFVTAVAACLAMCIARSMIVCVCRYI